MFRLSRPMEPSAILSFGVSKVPPKPASLAAHPADVRRSIEIKRLNFSLALCNHVHYSVAMIKNFRDNWLRNFFVEDIQSKKIPADIGSRLFRKLQLLDDATSDVDLRSPPQQSF